MEILLYITPMSDSGKPSHSEAGANPGAALRRGWTTGTCAAAAARAACQALFGGGFPDPVAVTLPNGTRPSFALALQEMGDGWARAGIVKDAGDDPDVTHGALIVACVSRGRPGSGVTFSAGPGVGTVARGPSHSAGDPRSSGSARDDLAKPCARPRRFTASPETLPLKSPFRGEKIAGRTLNARLGVIGGLSILGTTGIVVPYSCAAWIDTIHRGIDVARAAGLTHIAGATGAASEAVTAREYSLPEIALIDMGGFVGGMLNTSKRTRCPASLSPAASLKCRSSRPGGSTCIPSGALRTFRCSQAGSAISARTKPRFRKPGSRRPQLSSSIWLSAQICRWRTTLRASPWLRYAKC